MVNRINIAELHPLKTKQMIIVRITVRYKVELDVLFNNPGRLLTVDINELNALVSVVQTGNLTESAKKLRLPKSTLSRRIKMLEEKLGQTLLRRESNGLIPTEAGYTFYRYALDIVKLVDNGRAAIDEIREEVSGELDLWCHDALMRGWFAPIVSRFTDEHPDLCVRINTQSTREQNFEEEGICVWLGNEPDTRMRVEKLGCLEQKVYVSPDYLKRIGTPLKPLDLKHHKWIDLMSASHQHLAFEHPLYGQQTVSLPSSRMVVDRLVLQSDAIASGAGLGLLPTWAANGRLRHHPGIFETCMDEWKGPYLGVYLVFPHGPLSRKQRRFIRYVRESVPQEWRGEKVSNQYVA